MALNLQQLRAFIAVAESNNFTRAANVLNMAQPKVSALIAGLEAELGFRIFDRTTRHVELTEAATEFLIDAQRLIGELDRAVLRAHDIGSRRRGQLTIAAPPLLAATLMTDVILNFAKAAPGVKVTLLDRPIRTISALVQEGEVQLAAGTFAPEEGLTSVPLIVDRFSLVCRVDHPLAEHSEVDWAQLAGWPLVALRRGNHIRDQAELGYEAAGLRIEPAFELDLISTAIAMVKAGVGITVLPPYPLASLPTRSLVVRPLRRPSIMREIQAIYRTAQSLSPAAAEFLRQLRFKVAQLQPGSSTSNGRRRRGRT